MTPTPKKETQPIKRSPGPGLNDDIGSSGGFVEGVDQPESKGLAREKGRDRKKARI